MVAKCTKKKNARPKRAKLLFFIVEYASLDAINSKNLQSLTVDSFSCQNSVQIVFWLMKNVVGFESSAKFRFSTNHDLEIATLRS